MRMLANVPRIITSWLPRREPYELKSRALDAVLDEPPPGRAVGADRARRRDVVGGDAVAEEREHTRAFDVAAARAALRSDAFEERRAADVRRVGIPRVAVAGRRVERAPALVAVEDRGVVAAEHLGVEHRRRRPRATSSSPGQMSRRYTGAPVSSCAERLVDEVDVHRARERVRDDERRRREVVHPAVGVDAALEVAVAGQHRRDREVTLVDRLGDLGRERPRVADARRAAVADDVEAELRERRHQPRRARSSR